MKTAISIPDPVFKDAEKLARKMHISRSQLYATAVSKYVHERAGQDVTRRLNLVYAGAVHEESRLPDDVSGMQHIVLNSGDW